jgi:ABC-type proline/glycine betaine transport system substrate-binding protein
VACIALGVLGISQAAWQTVRLSDIGWTDVTATTAVFSARLQHLRR